jgi:hypothetical protein
MISCHFRHTSAAEHRVSEGRYRATYLHGSLSIALSYEGRRSSIISFLDDVGVRSSSSIDSIVEEVFQAIQH